MAYQSLEDCLLDLESNGQLIRIKEETDPLLQMAAIHLKVFEAHGPALLFENVISENNGIPAFIKDRARSISGKFKGIPA